MVWHDLSSRKLYCCQSYIIYNIDNTRNTNNIYVYFVCNKPQITEKTKYTNIFDRFSFVRIPIKYIIYYKALKTYYNWTLLLSICDFIIY